MYCAAFTHHDEALHQALRMKSAVLGQSISDLVNEAVKLSLGEEAEDFAELTARAIEPALSFESVVADLQSRGKV